jgi:hypothetical protein
MNPVLASIIGATGGTTSVRAQGTTLRAKS